MRKRTLLFASALAIGVLTGCAVPRHLCAWERVPVGEGYSARVTKSDGYRVIGSMCCDSRKFVHSFHEKQKVALESPLKRLIDEVLAPDATYT
jgi:hypothetical protein